MKTHIFVVMLSGMMLCLTSGCALSSGVKKYSSDALAVAAGGAAAYELSDRNPTWALAGGLGALAVKRSVDSASETSRKKELKETYDFAYSQACKENYWLIQNLQAQGAKAEQTAQREEYITIPITAPQRTVNGMTVESTVEYIKIRKG
jgi:hypothetical protein